LKVTITTGMGLDTKIWGLGLGRILPDKNLSYKRFIDTLFVFFVESCLVISGNITLRSFLYLAGSNVPKNKIVATLQMRI